MKYVYIAICDLKKNWNFFLHFSDRILLFYMVNLGWGEIFVEKNIYNQF